MEEFKLFNELNFLKNEIEKDLTVLNTLQCDMMLKDAHEKNRELTEKLRSSHNELEFKIDELKKEISGLEKKLEKKEKILTEKEEQIRGINDNLKLTIEENQRLNWNNCELKGKVLLKFLIR